MLITAAKPDGSVNTMTASWGGFGVMWNKEVAFVVIRPQRYTREFVESSESFSLTFFDNSYKKALSHLGSTSGRDEDKIAKTGLTVVMEDSIPYFEEAETAIFVKKLFIQRIQEDAFLDKGIIEKWYPEKDFHFLYIAEITNILAKE
jgi:flavin reductase (DIM6/NTAB) family NADH-FMN oxidoreductase RutF